MIEPSAHFPLEAGAKRDDVVLHPRPGTPKPPPCTSWQCPSHPALPEPVLALVSGHSLLPRPQLMAFLCVPNTYPRLLVQPGTFATADPRAWNALPHPFSRPCRSQFRHHLRREAFQPAPRKEPRVLSPWFAVVQTALPILALRRSATEVTFCLGPVSPTALDVP